MSEIKRLGNVEKKVETIFDRTLEELRPLKLELIDILTDANWIHAITVADVLFDTIDKAYAQVIFQLLNIRYCFTEAGKE